MIDQKHKFFLILLVVLGPESAIVVNQIEVIDNNFPPWTTRVRKVSNTAVVTIKIEKSEQFFNRLSLPPQRA